MNAFGITLALLGTVLEIAGWFGAARVRSWQEQLHKLFQVRHRVKDIVVWLARFRKILFRLFVPLVFLGILAAIVVFIILILRNITLDPRELFSAALLGFAFWFPVMVIIVCLAAIVGGFQQSWPFSQGHYDDKAQKATAATNWRAILGFAEAIIIFMSVGFLFSTESWLQGIGKGSVVIFLCLSSLVIVSLGTLLHPSEVIATKVAWLIGLLVLPLALLGFSASWIVLSPFLFAELISSKLPDHPPFFKVLGFLLVFVGGALQLLEVLLSKGP